MKKFLSLLFLSTNVLAYGGGSGGSLGGTPPVLSGAVKVHTNFCLDKNGEFNTDTKELRRDLKCEITEHDLIDKINYGHPSDDELKEIRGRMSLQKGH